MPHDDLFAKGPKYLWPLKGPKYYAVKTLPVFLGTLGGIKINHKAEVVDKKDRVGHKSNNKKARKHSGHPIVLISTGGLI
jgi:hypothetical protein